MKDSFRFWSGLILLLVGIGLLIASFFAWFLVFYAFPLIVIGILLLINYGNEEKIEMIKNTKNK